MKAIAAMALNRVIGQEGKIPWHIPEDFRWFKKTTQGHWIVMGRKTFESLGRPLPNRRNIVLSRGAPIDGVEVLHDLAQLEKPPEGTEIFLIGGSEIYRQYLGQCDELFLSLVFREVAGDAFFPPFEADFTLSEVVLKHADFEVRRYVRKSAQIT
ncbi:MAG: dihydrofolate reductase [Chthoniobacterales bacterium]